MWKKVANFIVRFDKLFLFLFLILGIASALTINLVKVEYDITTYLPAGTDTKLALDIMDDEFKTYGTSSFVIKNVTFEEADQLKEKIEDIPGVKSIPFENTPEYYHDLTALFTVTYDGTEDDEICVQAYNQISFYLEDYDVIISTSLVDTTAEQLSQDVLIITIAAVAVIIAVVLFTSKNWLDIIVLLPVFGLAALLNIGTNWWFGTISFVTNSVCIILQLALAIDYSIILLHRFAEEKTRRENEGSAKKAMASALSKAIPEIMGSSLTTICGLLALVFMSFTLGRDLGLILSKAIVCSMLSVFFFMPSIALILSKLMSKTEHKSFVPKIRFLGKGLHKIRYGVVPAFLIVVGLLGFFSFRLDYVYSATSIDTFTPTENQKANKEIAKIFGDKNQFLILVPYDNDEYTEEKKVVELLKTEDEQISDIISISNVSVTMNGKELYIVDKINYKEFAKFVGISNDLSKTIYTSYALSTQDEEISQGIQFSVYPDLYKVSLLNMLNRMNEYNNIVENALANKPDTLESYKDAQDQIQDAQEQLIGKKYTRIVFNIKTAVESQETFQLIERMKIIIKDECPKAIFAGDSMSCYDLNASFSTDNTLITVLTIVFVYLVLIFTTKSWGIPALLVATIQGSIFINFGLPALIGRNLFFLVYLIVSAIQMGATIDYAIVITTRYQALRETEHRKEAMIQAISDSFPTVLTSGTIMIVCGLLVGGIARMPLIGTLGYALARGVAVSILCVLLVLPVLLYFFGDWLTLHTKLPNVTFKFKEAIAKVRPQRDQAHPIEQSEKINKKDLIDVKPIKEKREKNI